MIEVKVSLLDDDQGYSLESIIVPIATEASVRHLEKLGRSGAEASICGHVRRGHPDFDNRYPDARWVVSWPKGGPYA
jgi:hypothetical protein